jgi:hypothetical protein
MSNRFIEFTDSLCRPQSIRHDPQLLRHFVLATSKIVDLAQQINPNIKGEDRPGGNSNVILKFPVRAISEISSSNDHVAFGVGITKASQTPAEHFEFGYRFGSHHTQYVHIIAHSTLRSKVLNSFRLPPFSFPLYTDDIMSDSWLGQIPISSTDPQLFTPKPNRRASSDLFGFKLLLSTVNIAYRYLLGESNSTAAVATQMFRFALLHHSREEILFKIRWFLGPGYPYLSNLGHAFLMPEDIPEVAEIFSILSLSVDKTAIDEAGLEAAAALFLNAFGVEDYLRTKGAIYMDDEIVLMKVDNTGSAVDTSGIDKPPQSLLFPQSLSEDEIAPRSSHRKGYAKSQDTTSGIHDQSLEDSEMAPPQVSPSKTALGGTPITQTAKHAGQASDYMTGFSFASLLPTSRFQSMKMPSDSGWISQISSYDAGSVTISTPHLLQIITNDSFCLRAGPGYLRSSVDYIIDALTFDRLVF